MKIMLEVDRYENDYTQYIQNQVHSLEENQYISNENIKSISTCSKLAYTQILTV